MKKCIQVLVCFIVFTMSFAGTANTASAYSTYPYDIQYRSTGEDAHGFTAQITIINHTDQDMEQWSLGFDYNEQIILPKTISMSVSDYGKDHRYRFHYQFQVKGQEECIPANGSMTINYRVDSALQINNNPQNYTFDYTLRNQVNKLPVKAERAANQVKLRWQPQEKMQYRVEKGSSVNTMQEQNGALIGSGMYLDEDEDTSVTRYYRVKGYADEKVITQSDILELKGYIDSDNDGLSDVQEELYKTDKNNPDSDNDGLSDYLEIHVYFSDPLLRDSDHDGLDDGVELSAGLHPMKKDSDNNGILDLDEDSDYDGLTNKEELAFHSSLILVDSDGDGLRDVEEKNCKTDPNEQDTDNDGLHDKEEITLGTNPLHPDSNNNGVKDGEDFYTIQKQADVQKENAPILDVKINGVQYKTLHIEEVSNHDPILNEKLPGYLGSAWQLEVDGSFQNAEVSFPYDRTAKEGIEPRIYTYNESTQLLEELPEQVVKDGKVRAKLEHLSNYILLDKKEFDAVWNSDIHSPSDNANMDMAFVIDNSGSMAWNDPEKLRIDLTKAFVDKLHDTDRGTLISFCRYATLMNNLTGDKGIMKAAADRVSAMSTDGTSVYNGMKTALDELKNKEQGNKKFMFVLSDGMDTETYTYDAILKDMKDSDITAYTLGLGKEMDTELLTRIATETGGKYFHASTSGDMVGEFDKLVGETVDFVTDSDQDGISDYYEKAINSEKLRLGTGRTLAGKLDINNADSDQDGLKDGQEIEVAEVDGKIYVKTDSDPTLFDSDGDGYNDYLEFKNQTDSFGWDVTPRDMAMSTNLAYEDFNVGSEVSALTQYDTEFKEHGTYGEMKGWKVIKSIPDTKTGFSAMALRNNHKIIIAYRGTNGQFEDILQTDIYSWFYEFNQQENETNEFITELMLQYPKDEIYVCGHSLGGNLAYMGGGFGLMLDAKRIKNIGVFNAYGMVEAPLAHRYDNIKDNLKAYKERVKNYRVEGDRISKLPLTVQYGQTVKVDYCWEHLSLINGMLGDAISAHRIHSIIHGLPRVRLS